MSRVHPYSVGNSHSSGGSLCDDLSRLDRLLWLASVASLIVSQLRFWQFYGSLYLVGTPGSTALLSCPREPVAQQPTEPVEAISGWDRAGMLCCCAMAIAICPTKMGLDIIVARRTDRRFRLKVLSYTLSFFNILLGCVWSVLQTPSFVRTPTVECREVAGEVVINIIAGVVIILPLLLLPIALVKYLCSGCSAESAWSPRNLVKGLIPLSFGTTALILIIFGVMNFREVVAIQVLVLDSAVAALHTILMCSKHAY